VRLIIDRIELEMAFWFKCKDSSMCTYGNCIECALENKFEEVKENGDEREDAMQDQETIIPGK